MRIAILGGGIGGLSLAWYLHHAQPGAHELTLFEQSLTPGGLVTGFQVEGYTFDRHYHCVLTTDHEVRHLVEALGLEHQLRFKQTRMGFYDGERCIPFNNPFDLLRFPLLGPLDKLRLIFTILYCQHAGDAETLHKTPLEPWLRGLAGTRTFERVWAPLLCSKFDGNFDGIPATYIWSRMRRMQSTREKGGAVEKLGILHGGTTTLVKALAQRLPSLGVRLCLGASVSGLVARGAQQGVMTPAGEEGPYDLVISTLPTPVHQRIASGAQAQPRHAMPEKYLGIVDVVLLLRRSLTPYYTLNLLDRRLPFTGIIETSHLMDPQDRGPYHVVYLPRYTDARGPIYAQSDEQLQQQFCETLLRMFPDLSAEDILQVHLFREPFVEPLTLCGGAFAPFPESLSTERRGVYLMNTGRLYPELHNCQAVIGLARRTANHLLERHG